MEVRPGYKQTEVGVIPEDWQICTLASLMDPSRPARYGIVQPGAYASNGVLMLRSQDYSKGWVDCAVMHRARASLAIQYQNARLKARDLVMTVVGANTGQVVEVPPWLKGGVLSRSTARIAIDEGKADNRFLKFFLQSRPSQRQVRDSLKEGAQPVLSCADLARFRVPLPPTKAEQEAIAEALSDADALIESLEQLLTKKRHIKQGAMQELLTGKKRLPGFETRPGHKQTEAGVIPEDWDLHPLGSVGRWFSGGTPSMSNRAYWYGDIPWVSPKDMKVSRLCGAIDHITTKAVEDGAKVLPVGAILAVIRGMILAHSFPVARAEVPLAFNQDIKAVVTADGIDDIFLLYWLTANAARLRGLTTESTHGTKRLPAEMLFRELLALPPAAEQAAIAATLSDMDAEITALDEKLAKARQIKQGMMQELLTGRIRLA